MDIAAYAFDANDNIKGTIRTWTSCSSGGRGSHPTVYQVFTDVVWDNHGHYLTLLPFSGKSPVLGAPILDQCYTLGIVPYNPAYWSCNVIYLVATDSVGNRIAWGANAAWVINP